MCRKKLGVLIRVGCAAVLYCFAGLSPASAQEGRERTTQAGSLDHSIRELQIQVQKLQSALVSMRAEMSSYRSEILQTRRELEDARAQLAGQGRRTEPPPRAYGSLSEQSVAVHTQQQSDAANSQQSDNERLAKLEEDHQLLNSKIDEQYQTKVETASKYRVRLSGIALFNTFSNAGTVDNLDVPRLAAAPGTLDSGGAFGASLRQSQVGLEVFGPEFQGSKIVGDIQMDFSGGFTSTLNGVNFGLARLRTATLRLNWPRTSIVAGQDTLFFSPLSPTSFASLAVPAFSYAGNLWGWVPQVRVEHRVEVSSDSSLTLQAGILDPVSGQPPATSYLRSPQAGERSRQPAYAARVAWSRGPADQKLTLGLGSYYSRQNWGFNRGVDAWAGMMDWSIPLGRRVTLTGKFYRGRAVGGLDGAFGRSIVTGGALSDPTTSVHGLNSAGGWTQLKFRASSTLEFNGAVGQENPWASDLRFFAVRQSNLYPSAARNRVSLANFIYRPRSDVVFSVEYRRFRTFGLSAETHTADHVNFVLGILF